MKSHPILFSAPMVRAILEGRKTQTRRIIKGVPSGLHYGKDIMDWELSGIHQKEKALQGTDRWCLDIQTKVDDFSREIILCPGGAPGDQLWVRETWQYCDWSHDGEPYIHYKADGAVKFLPGIGEEDAGAPLDKWEALSTGENRAIDGKSADRVWRPSIHMPRWASRITLEITGVRVERLQGISEADAIAEGCTANHNGYYWGGPHPDYGLKQMATALKAYRDLWQSIHGAESWDANPWVWVYEFKRVAV